MASTLTTFDAFLKEFYADPSRIENLTYKERALFAEITKEPDQAGDLYVHPVIHGNPQGLGATRATAQTGAQQSGGGGNLKGKKWQVTYGDYKGSVEVGDKVIKASRNNVGAFLRNQKIEVDSLYDAFGDTFGYYVYANSGMALNPSGVATISTGVITLDDANDVANFEEGMILNASAGDGTSTGHTLLGSGSDGYVIAVNRNAGTVTVSASAGGSAGTPSGWTGNMYLFRAGDFGGTASPNRIILGLSAWIPSSDPSSTTFEGVDRTIDITRLSGVRLPSGDVSGLNNEGRIKLLATRMMGRAGSKRPDAFFMHPEKWQNLANSLESRGQRDIGEETKFGYSKLKLSTAGGMVEVYADRFCPVGAIFAINKSVVKLGSYDKVPHVLNGDGLEMLRKSSTDDYEHRIVAYPAFCVAAPGYCGRITAA